jgi:hypothetical protein
LQRVAGLSGPSPLAGEGGSQTSLRSLRTLDCVSAGRMRGMLLLFHPHPSLLRNDTFSHQWRRSANDQRPNLKNLMFEKLSPVLRTLLSSPHPRPHEGLSRVVLKVRAGSGACGRGRPNLGSGRLSQTAISRHPPAAKPAGVEEVKPPSDPPVRHYDRAACFDGLRADRDGRRASEIREVRDAKDRNRRTRTPGDRFFKFRNGRSAPVSSLFAFRARGLRATAMTHAS